jgi:fumarate reductase flavoprotein subunit
VLHEDDQKVIPGLFAAGMDASSIFGEVYDFSVSGEATAVSIITGRIAGENAAKSINKK